MMPDLGKYADAVLSAYAASVVLLIIIVATTLIRGRKVRAEMDAFEKRVKRDG